MSSTSSNPTPLNSFRILKALKTVIPHALVLTGRTSLPVLTIPRQQITGRTVGPVKVFYNLAPQQFRVVDDSSPKYEHRCGSAWDLLEELENVLEMELLDPPEEIQHLE